MPYSNPCTSAKNEYTGHATQVLYSITFEYTKQSDVKVYVWNDNQYELNTDWTFDNATQIRFNNPVPPSTNPVGQPAIRIVRETDIEPLNAQFYPGASIKAKDLNDNFEQLKFAVEENRCIADADYWKKYEGTIHSNETWSGSDNLIATTAAIDAAFLRQDSTETINSGMPWSNSDAFVATTAAIDARVVDLVEEVGGFVPIDNETSFPEENPDINDGDGTLISIKEISTDRGIGGGTVTITNGAGTNTVTITGVPTTGMLAGYGAIVETTSTLHTYAFHRLAPPAIEVTTVANNIGDVQITANDIDNINTVAGDIANINTVEGSIANVNTVATNIADVNTLATNIGDINIIEDNIADINTVANDLNEPISEIDVVATNIADVNTVGTNIGDVNTVATNISDINTVEDNIPNITLVSTNVPDINTIATNITNVNAVGADLLEPVSEIDTVATNIANVNAVGTDITNVNTVATNIDSVNDFADKYRIGPTDPTTDNDEGDLFYNTTSDTLKIWNGTTWEVGVTETTGFVATAGGTMTGDLVMGDGVTNNNITNLADPSNAQDAATKNYVDTQVGGIDELVEDPSPQLAADLDAQTFKVTNLGNPTAAQDAATKNYVDTEVGAIVTDLVSDTTPQLGGNLDTNGFAITTAGNNDLALSPSGTGNIVATANRITNVADPTAAQDAATKNYVDTQISGIDEVVEDTTPQLGGDLDVNGNSIVSVSNGDINITPDGTGRFTLGGNSVIKTTGGTNALTFETGNLIINDKLTNVTDPTNAQDAATKNYVDTATAGISSDKITEGNTEAEVVDVAPDGNGHFKITTEGTEQIRIGPNGEIGINGANYGTSGQVLTSKGLNNRVAWEDAASGATGGGSDTWAVEHDNTITTSYTITSGKNVISAGPMTINSGATVTVPSGSNWVIA